MWHMTHDMWHGTHDTWHATCDMWRVMGGEYYLKTSAPQLFWFVIYEILKIRRTRLTDWINELINHEADCKTAPATPGLLIIAHTWQNKTSWETPNLFSKYKIYIYIYLFKKRGNVFVVVYLVVFVILVVVLVDVTVVLIVILTVIMI